MSNKILLNLNETNELTFRLHIQGMSSEPNVNAPVCRFIVQESNNKDVSLGYVFPVIKNDDNTVTICIPPMKDVFKETKEYNGKMEVILGSRYFTPVSLNLEFSQPTTITAESVIVSKPKESSLDIVAEQIKIESKPKLNLDEIMNSLEKKEKINENQIVELTKSQIEELINRKKIQKQNSKLSQTQDVKQKFKSLLKDSLK